MLLATMQKYSVINHLFLFLEVLSIQKSKRYKREHAFPSNIFCVAANYK